MKHQKREKGKKGKNKVNYIFTVNRITKRILFQPAGRLSDNIFSRATILNYFYFSETIKCGISFFIIKKVILTHATIASLNGRGDKRSFSFCN